MFTFADSINRTTLELKQSNSRTAKSYPIDYKSHHTGIETGDMYIGECEKQAINRTTLELKLLCVSMFPESVETINRTTLELKRALGLRE